MYKTLVRERDGRMTDNEIIKYLEQAIDKYNKNEIFVDNIRLDKLSLELIKQKQAEIEKLKIENKSLRSAANSYKLHYNNARTEAVKELIEKLTKEYAHCTLDFTTTIDIFFCSVKRIAKEMAGDTE